MNRNPNIDYEFLADANRRLAGKSVNDVLRWAVETFDTDGVAMTSALGYSGLVLLHHALQVRPQMKVYFIDTGFHFPETLEFRDRIADEWNVQMITVGPSVSREFLHERIGDRPYETNADLCCHYCKVEPLLTFLHKHDAWLSGIRRDQSLSREGIETIEVDGRGTIKISPMAHWTRNDTWAYLKKHALPYHPLHDKGYVSIGCAPCTCAVGENQHERDGRWPFMQKLECGIHLDAEKDK